LNSTGRTSPTTREDDDIITLDLARQRPDLIDQYPDARNDLERIKQEILKPEKPGLLDYPKQAVGRFVRGAADVIAGLPESVAIGAKALEHATGVSLGEPENIEDLPTYQLSQKIRALGEKLSPEEVEGLKKSFLTSTVPGALGSAVGFMAGGGAGKGLFKAG
jgi:hypothetical protein